MLPTQETVIILDLITEHVGLPSEIIETPSHLRDLPINGESIGELFQGGKETKIESERGKLGQRAAFKRPLKKRTKSKEIMAERQGKEEKAGREGRLFVRKLQLSKVSDEEKVSSASAKRCPLAKGREATAQRLIA